MHVVAIDRACFFSVLCVKGCVVCEGRYRVECNSSKEKEKNTQFTAFKWGSMSRGLGRSSAVEDVAAVLLKVLVLLRILRRSSSSACCVVEGVKGAEAARSTHQCVFVEVSF